MGWSVADESANIFLTLKRGAVPRSELMVLFFHNMATKITLVTAIWQSKLLDKCFNIATMCSIFHCPHVS